MIHSCLVWFLWWLRHGAIGPNEATSFVGSMLTDLKSEFTHFNSVIRLSNVQQSALQFCTFLWCPASPAVLWKPLNCIPAEWCVSEQPKTFLSSQQFVHSYYMTMKQGRHKTCRCVFFFWWLSGEVIHVVHLIRWNLTAVLCHWGTNWLRAWSGLTHDF